VGKKKKKKKKKKKRDDVIGSRTRDLPAWSIAPYTNGYRLPC
jgi:hypothetical protein